ncbi:MAG: phage tail assembly protein [Pseudomonadota bacterium]
MTKATDKNTPQSEEATQPLPDPEMGSGSAGAAQKPAPVVAFADPKFAAGKVYKLQHPLNVDGETLSQIEVPRRSIGELAPLVEALSGDRGLRGLVTAYVGLHPAIIDGLYWEDYTGLEEAVTPFLPLTVQEAILEFKKRLASLTGDNSPPNSPSDTDGD